ncbi:uncharacterized protein LOC143002125 [Genypterus blacodes]|uniref:uncharacterized protein LOC143002125 n=1 Tax=Genypterus blacodes TaxID=154954 RepID=UPI003F7717B4
MERPPGSFDDLQPQDLSTSSIPTVMDLTRRGEDCVLNSASLEALRMVKSPGWYPNSGSGVTGLPLSETGSSDILLQPGDQVQPDDAFSHTTVTLSYVSRSHVFSAHDSLSQHSPLYSVPSISKFSVHPPCDSEKGLEDSGYALNQQYLEQVDGPMDLATQTDLYQSDAEVGQENNALVSRPQQPHEFNGGLNSSDSDVNKPLLGDQGHGLSQDAGGGVVLENGRGDSCSGSAVCAMSSPESLSPVLSGEQEPVSVPDSRQYVSPLEEPLSPSATSLDHGEDVFLLPQASSSPSGDNSAFEVVLDDPAEEESTQPSVPPPRLESSNKNTRAAHKRKAVLEPLIDLTGEDLVSPVSEKKQSRKKTVNPHMNGNVKALQRTLKVKKLPARSGRGTRLEAIVMNINSSRYKVSGCIRTGDRTNASKAAGSVTKLSSPKKKNNNVLSGGKNKGKVKAVKKKKQKAAASVRRGKANSINTDTCKDSTSDCEIVNNSKIPDSSASSPQCAEGEEPKEQPEDASDSGPPLHTSPKKSPRVKSKTKPTPESGSECAERTTTEPDLITQPEPSLEIQVERISPPPPSPPPKKSRGKAKAKAGGKTSPASKKKKAAGQPSKRRRRKRLNHSQPSSMFSPKEPEIKLRYVNYKEEKREPRSDSFSPFVHVERKDPSPSLCTVINYSEQASAQQKKGQLPAQGHAGAFMSAVVPSTSCLQLGRASMHSQHRRPLVCCLCGLAANAMDLGDLHGPYYPEGYRPSAKTPASASGLKEGEDDYSDSDSSSCSVKRAVPPPKWPPGPGSQPDLSRSPTAKRARLDGASTSAEDWYSAPSVPMEPCEHWLHEDCCVWSAGVFLVKGKVYGLEEAVKAAQETTCSSCHRPGATLGCFFKGCPNKYHYRCALESDCVLIEENFSMKCKKHKNKTFKAPRGNRWDDR